VDPQFAEPGASGLQRLGADRGQEPGEVPALAVRPPSPEGVPEKGERDVLVLSPTLIVFTVDDPRFVRGSRKPTSFIRAAIRPSTPDRDYYTQAAERLDSDRASLAVARKLLKRSYHTLRDLGEVSQAGFHGDVETRDTPLERGTPRSWHDRRSTPMS
jgi:hypothetical protein